MIAIRSCEGFDEMQACVDLEVATWGYDDKETVPRKTFLLAQKIGGQVIGAFDSAAEGGAPSLVGFAMALPGIKTVNGRPVAYLHSHMLAVHESHRNRGLGAQLKQAQRREALERGIRLMEWTFDPLEIKNAFLNIRRLGAVVRTYYENFYGVSSSRLQGGLPTDRLLAEWELDSPRVQAILDGRPAADQVIEERIPVPAAIRQWRADEKERERALTVQLENRRRFQQAFARGLAVTGFTRDAEGNGVFELGPLLSPNCSFQS
jgi:predicted GNAT superfamily acetyltransferase